MKHTRFLALTPLACLLAIATAPGQTFGPDFAGDYDLVDLGQPPGLPTPFGGVLFKAGKPDTLLIAGASAQPTGQFFEVTLTRDSGGRINGFSGSATPVITAPNADGGLRYGPGDVLLYTTYPTNTFCQVLPGSSVADKVIDLGLLGVISSTGGLGLVPSGFPGAGGLKIQSYDGATSYAADLVPDGGGTGTFDLANLQLAATFTPGIGPESLVYVAAGQPGFAADSALLTEFGSGEVGAYEVDAAGNPLPGTRRQFLSIEDIDGSVRDPKTGDYVFSRYDSSVPADNSIVLVYRKSPLAPYCFGDLGSGTPCPCGNDNDGSVPGSGCANGVFASGAQLTGSGLASLGNDTLVLHTTGLEPGNSGLYFQANNDLSPGIIWGDGLRCAGGGLVRLGVRIADGTGYSDTSGYPYSISARSAAFGRVIVAGETLYYQCWYRNPNGSPCATDFNASNGGAVTWSP